MANTTDISRETSPTPESGEPQYPERILGVRTRGRFFFGWYLVSAGAAIQFLVGALMNNAIGGYATALTNDFGWSRSSLSLGFAFARVESGILGPFQGWLIDRFGPRAIMRVGLTMFALGFFLFSQLNSLPMFYVSFLLMAVGSSLGGFMSMTVAVVNWFDRSRARALGVSQAGMGIGGLAAAGVIYLVIEVGWREMAFVSGLLVLAIGLPLTTFIVRRPEEIGLHMDGHDPEEVARLAADDLARNRRSESTTVDFTTRQALRTRAFWMISFGHASALFVVGALMLHLVLYLTEGLGYSAWAASAVVLAMTVFQLVGQVGGAALGDFVSKRLIVIVCMAMHVVAVLLLAHVGTTWAVMAFTVLHGTAWGTRGPLMQAMRADYFGRTSFGKIMGFSSAVIMIGITGGQLLPGFFYDRTGSYELGFTIVAVIAALGSVFFVLSTRPPLPTALPEDSVSTD